MSGEREVRGPSGRPARRTLAARLRDLRAGHTLFAFADQAVVSLGSFLVAILLAQRLPTADFGVYALLVSIFIMANTVHGALVAYPLSVAGATADAGRLRDLAREALGLTLMAGAPIGAAVLGVACLAVGRPSLLPWAVATLVAWQLQETTRRALISKLRYRAAMGGDAVSYLGQAVVVLVLAAMGRLSLEAVLLGMAATSVAGMVVQAVPVGVRSIGLRGVVPVARRSYGFGRWAFLSNVAGGASQQVVIWTLVVAHGVERVAETEATANLLKLTHPLLLGISSLVVPAAAAARHGGGLPAAAKTAARYGAQGAALLLPYCAAVAVWPHAALSAFYGSGSAYAHLEGVLRLFALLYLSNYFASVVESFLNGVERSRSALSAQLVGVGVTVTVAVLLAVRYGVPGAIFGLAVASAVRLAVSLWLARRLVRGEAEVAGAAAPAGAGRSGRARVYAAGPWPTR